MLITVTSASFLERSTRLMCPVCSAPIVGTNPMVDPDARNLATASLTAAIVLTTTMSVAVLGIRISARPYFGAKRANGLFHDRREVGVLLQEFRSEAFVQSEQIRKHQNLPVAVRAGAYSDCRNGQSLRYSLC